MIRRRTTIKLVLAVGDYLLMGAALAVMLLIRYGQGEFAEEIARHLPVFLPIFLLWVITFYVLEVYNIVAPFNHRKFLVAMVGSIALAIGVLYIFGDFVGITPRRNLLITVAVFVPGFYSWRFLAMRVVDRFSVGRSVAVVGSDEHALALIRAVQSQRRQGFRVVAVVEDQESPVPEELRRGGSGGGRAGLQVFSSLAELKARVQELEIAAVIISDAWYLELYADLYSLIPLRIRFFQLTSFWEEFLESIPIYSARESWFLENFNRGTSRGYMVAKRLGDTLAVLLFSPLVVALATLTALAVRLSSKGPVIFSQTRVGRNGQDYTVYKFRSMYVDAEKHGAQWAQKNDPRVTPVGRFIRATRLDEIPQLWNVLRGDMSLIGPRPERPEFVSDLAQQIPHYHLRHLVRPGLTGWAQVKYRYGSSVEDAAVKLTYDLYYVKNISLVLDIKITLKTILTVLSRQGQ